MRRIDGDQDVQLRGRRVRFNDSGVGSTPLLLLHGCAFDREQWTALAPGLGEHYRVVAIDAPGCGGSAADSAQPSFIRAYAEAALDVIAALALGRVAIVGHSFGAAVGVRIATEHPEFVSRLVLISLLPSRRPRALRERLAGGRVFPNSLVMRWLRARVLSVHRGPHASAVAEPYATNFLARLAGAERFDVAANTALRIVDELARDRTLDAQLARLRTPTALIFGRGDPLVRASLAPRLAREIGARRLDVLECEHTPERELPDAVAQIVEQFLRDATSAASTVTARPRFGATWR